MITSAQARAFTKHSIEVKTILKEQKCMDSKGQLRSWKKTTWDLLKQAGHNTLDPMRCRCAITQ